MARELRGVSSSGTLYARILNSAGYSWNGSVFEAYNASNYSAYDIAMTEQGDSGVYVADFPTTITTSGTYEYFVHKQAAGAPAEGDTVVNTGKVDWTGTVASTSSPDTLIRGVAASGTLYARLMNSSGLWWNGASFEAYSAGSYSTYDIAMTEQGNSGVYVAAFPSSISTSGRYEYFVHKQLGASPAEGDQIVNTGTVNWDSTTTILASFGAMSASEWRAYVLRKGFKRTDKDTELYEATTDAIQELRRRFSFDVAETESTITDTISVLGDFKMSQGSDLGMLQGIVLEDDDTGTPLTRVSKAIFDEMYPSINVESDRGYPQHYCLFGGYIYIGPIPDSVSYAYRQSYSQRAGVVTASTTGVPFTNLYRDVLCDLVISLLYDGLDEMDRAGFYRQKFEAGLLLCIRRERINSGVGLFQVRTTDC